MSDGVTLIPPFLVAPLLIAFDSVRVPLPSGLGCQKRKLGLGPKVLVVDVKDCRSLVTIGNTSVNATRVTFFMLGTPALHGHAYSQPPIPVMLARGVAHLDNTP